MKNIQQIYKENAEFRESRLKSLFSDFISLKESNPEGYIANLNVWKQLLISVFEYEDILTFHYEEFQKKLIYRTNKNDFIPQGLYIVLNDMINNDKSIFVFSELERTEDPKLGIIGRLKNVIFGNYIVDVRDNSMKQEMLVPNEILKKKCSKIKSLLLPIIKNEPINLAHLRAILKESSITLSDADLLLSLKCIARESENICFKDGIIIQKQEVLNLETVTYMDNNELDDLRNVSDLNFTIYKLQQYNNEKLVEIKALDSKIRDSIRSKNLISSKTQFKLKKMLEQQVQKTLTSLENLYSLKIKVEDAQNNILISKIWKENSAVLKILNEKTEAKKIDDLFDDLYNEIQNTNNISNKLSSKIVEPDYEDDEIETQLTKLEATVTKEKEATEEEEEKEIQAVEDKLKDLKIPDKIPKKNPEIKQKVVAKELPKKTKVLLNAQM